MSRRDYLAQRTLRPHAGRIICRAVISTDQLSSAWASENTNPAGRPRTFVFCLQKGSISTANMRTRFSCLDCMIGKLDPYQFIPELCIPAIVRAGIVIVWHVPRGNGSYRDVWVKEHKSSKSGMLRLRAQPRIITLARIFNCFE